MINTALLVVDVQNDFCPGGSLAVTKGDSIIPNINRYIALTLLAGKKVFFSRDWHPTKTNHFKDFGGIWPVHCIKGTEGAQFHPLLDTRKGIIISKGFRENEDAFSAFDGFYTRPEFDFPDIGLSLDTMLRTAEINHLTICGLATDYCVKATVLDALTRGYGVDVPINAIKGVDLEPGDSLRALEEMFKAGAARTSF